MTKHTPQRTRGIAVCKVEKKAQPSKRAIRRSLWVVKYGKVENRTRALDCCIIDSNFARLAVK